MLAPRKKSSDELRQHFKSRHYFATKVCLVKAMIFFQESYMDVRVGLYRKLSTDELMLLNCGVGKDS